jgi:hypothetical protein
MLASITPLGERGRQSRWAVTVTAFALAAVAGGVAVGAALGAFGSLVLLGSLSWRARAAVLAVAAAVALALDVRGRGVPGPRRQVDVTWLDAFRGWVYGGGYGLQLGLGLVTVISSAATYLAVAAAFLSGSAGRGALVMGCYGAIRGVTPVLAARVDRPARLIAFQARFTAAAPVAARVAAVALAAVLVLALIWSFA